MASESRVLNSVTYCSLTFVLPLWRKSLAGDIWRDTLVLHIQKKQLFFQWPFGSPYWGWRSPHILMTVFHCHDKAAHPAWTYEPEVRPHLNSFRVKALIMPDDLPRCVWCFSHQMGYCKIWLCSGMCVWSQNLRLELLHPPQQNQHWLETGAVGFILTSCKD